MTYPKPVMSISELVSMGIPREDLKMYVHARNQNFARMTKGNGKWLIDTEKFEDWWCKKMRA